MARVRERPQLREHEVDERFREIVEREGPITEEPVRTGKRPIRWMQWLGAFVLLAAAATVVALLATDGETTEYSTYVPEPQAEMELIDQAVAAAMENRPYTYTGSAYAELALIEQAVADFRAAHPYVADAAVEMALIEQAVRSYDLRPSTYVADAYAELGMIEHALRWDPPSDYVAAAADEMALIEQAVRAYEFRPSTYVPDANLELALIEQAVLAAS